MCVHKLTTTSSLLALPARTRGLGRASWQRYVKFIAMTQYLNGNAKRLFFPAAGQSFQQFSVNRPDRLIPQNGVWWTWPTSGAAGTSHSAEDAFDQMIGYF